MRAQVMRRARRSLSLTKIGNGRHRGRLGCSGRVRWPLVGLLFLVAACLLVSCLVPLLGNAQTPGPDPYEPDDPDGGDPPWIGNGETQTRSFYPDGDVDYAHFRVKAGHWYDVHTQELALLVDTVLTVEIAGTTYQDDDGGSEPLASRIVFEAPATGDALITVVTSQGVYSTTQTYELYAGETAGPTPTPTTAPTSTPTSVPIATPEPTNTPAPTSTPQKPVVSFSAVPDYIQKPGDCVTLRWSVERASEVYLVYPNGNQVGVTGQEERQVCPTETSVYTLKVLAPGGNETVEVVVTVAGPTSTPTPTPTRSAGSGGSASGKATVHILVFVDEDRNDAYDPQEGVLGMGARLQSQANPGRAWSGTTDVQGQVHLAKVPSGSYTLLVPTLGRAETVSLRGEETTIGVAVPPVQLPTRIP